MTVVWSFPPVIGDGATRLILGSMPGRESLVKKEYYAHPRNAFWHIMGALWNFDPEAPFVVRCQALINARIALWDVLASCVRPGSLDGNIVTTTMVPNDIGTWLADRPSIACICFNGSMAERIFAQRIKPTLPMAVRSLPTWRLPSTSPAHASCSFAQKLEAWRQALGGDAANLAEGKFPERPQAGSFVGQS